MTGGELSAEERAQWRKDAERRRDGRGNTPQNQRILALLDALDAAEARVAAVEAERDERVERHAWDQARASRNRNRARAEAAEAEVVRLTADREKWRDASALVGAGYFEKWQDAEARATRLTHLLGSHADGHRCTCEMLSPSSHIQPAEWEQDPWCPTHPDVDYIRQQYDRLSALVEAGLALADKWERYGYEMEAADLRAVLRGMA
jgi:hypothetical protein